MVWRVVRVVLVAGLAASTIWIGVAALARSRGSRIRLVSPAAGPSISPVPSHVEQSSGLIVFAGSRDGRYHLYVINPDGTGSRELTYGVTEERTPEWSPDRQRIAFARFAEPGGSVADIYILEATGGSAVRLTRSPEVEEDPSWSPDGERIIFTASDRSTGRTRIRIARLDGKRSPQLPEPSIGNRRGRPTGCRSPSPGSAA
jgi:Tol biopolymer transport system component